MLVGESPATAGDAGEREEADGPRADPGQGFWPCWVAFQWSRLRRRAGMGTTGGRTWLIVMAVFIVGVLALWGYSMHR